MSDPATKTNGIILESTADGSHTLFVPALNEHYHSVFGAHQESTHVFIEAGLEYASEHFQEINLLEVGFGTGLNAFLTLLKMGNHQISYTAIEAYPVDMEIVDRLNYPEISGSREVFNRLHSVDWERFVDIVPGFRLRKIQSAIQVCDLPDNFFQLVYFDAFAPNVQPELWTAEVFLKIYQAMTAGGILVTYSSKGIVKQNLRAAGFRVDRLPGAAGKRHMLRATKTEG